MQILKSSNPGHECLNYRLMNTVLWGGFIFLDKNLRENLKNSLFQNCIVYINHFGQLFGLYLMQFRWDLNRCHQEDAGYAREGLPVYHNANRCKKQLMLTFTPMANLEFTLTLTSFFPLICQKIGKCAVIAKLFLFSFLFCDDFISQWPHACVFSA